MKRTLMSIFLLPMFSIPGVIWYRNTGDLSLYLNSSAPSGQLYYVLAKLAGLYALTCLIWQIVSITLSRLHVLQLDFRGAGHAIFGGMALLLTSTHAMLFMLAMNERQGFPPWGLLLPDFNGYYHSRLTLGLLGMVCLVAVLVTGWIRTKAPHSFAGVSHKLYWLMMGLAYVHAFSIGTESQTVSGWILFVIPGVSAAFLWLLMLVRQFKTKKAGS